MFKRLVLAAILAHAADLFAAQNPAAAAVVTYLQGITGSQVVSGQQDGPNPKPDTWTQRIRDMTGHYPALWGGDFGFESFDVAARPQLVKQVKSAWAAGSLVTLSWHACPPTVGTSCQWDSGEGAILSRLSDADWAELVSNGTPLNMRWKRRLDEVVPLLRDLKSSGVPVLFRPLHEMNDAWSWWGGRPGPDGSRKLFQITHHYLTTVHGLDNLVWVWNVKDVAGGVPQVEQYWPGGAYVDVVSLDVWVNKQPLRGWYDALVRLAAGKPLGLAEVGSIPSPETLAAQPRWSFFAVWREKLAHPAWNNAESVKRTYSDRRVLKRGDLSIGPAQQPLRRQPRDSRTSARP